MYESITIDKLAQHKQNDSISDNDLESVTDPIEGQKLSLCQIKSIHLILPQNLMKQRRRPGIESRQIFLLF
ncbi:hypothetical protein QQG55_52885 [Brugia pahangi]